MTALLPALLCGGGMLACFLFMSRMHRQDAAPSSQTSASSEEVAALREELGRLRAELPANDHPAVTERSVLDGRPTQSGEAALQRHEERLPRA